MPALEFLDSAALRRWCAAAAVALGAAREQINTLNVFPVADSDTGTNLHLTMLSADRALSELPHSADPQEVWQALAHGVLLGAQGNSGVIVSQFLRGLAEICAPVPRCDGPVVRHGLAHAARASYAAVGQPVEGTVLTVAAAGAAAAAAAGDALAAVAAAAAEGARRALARTTAQLDVLARAGVVDAGAAGLCLILDTLAAVVTGTAPASSAVPSAKPPTKSRAATGDGRLSGGPPGGPPGPPGRSPGYEVMYLLEAPDVEVARLRDQLGRLGDSVVVAGGAGLWNVHVHLADAGAAIEAGLATGRPRRIRVNYLGDVGSPPPDGGSAMSGRGAARPDGGASTVSGHAVVAVAAGDGVAALFGEAGAVVVRRPDELLRAVREAGAPTHNVVVLPDGAAAASVAHAAAARVRDEGINVVVVPAQAVVQSLSALAVHDPARRFDDDAAAMADAAAATRWGKVTWETAGPVPGRPAGPVPGQAAGRAAGEDVARGMDASAVAVSVAERLLAHGGELVTLVAGSPAGPGAPGGGEIADIVAARLEASRPDLEIISHEGGEPGYVLLIAVES